jgi:hypothetical protein
MDLVSLILTKAAEHTVGKVLDVVWDCFRCDQKRTRATIANVTHNHFYCSNCHMDHKQFTNACPSTIRTSGKIASVGAAFFPNDWEWRYQGNFLNKRCVGGRVPGRLFFDGFAGQQLIEINEIREHSSQRLFDSEHRALNVGRDFEQVPTWAYAYYEVLPANGRDLYDLDVRIETRFKEVLLRERVVIEI